ncbi:hypothetical protein F511_04022 [Dorcoceras hygrometricum]|uniref:Rab-GAP TBC domain-containing protein n=1 Tax=Dorcoceras hygrometricum TaxID=472368 RepID=A0A2Z7A7G5_9LAMI|nr:hypothetical protein F511_04022 [Dorcoceras hygrometricum]
MGKDQMEIKDICDSLDIRLILQSSRTWDTYRKIHFFQSSKGLHIFHLVRLCGGSKNSGKKLGQDGKEGNHLRSPWSRRKRKCILSFQQWQAFFTPEGKLRDSGIKLLKKVRSGVGYKSCDFNYDLTSSKEERDVIKTQKREEYENLRRICRQLHKHNDDSNLNRTRETSNGDDGSSTDCMYSLSSEDVVSARESLSSEERFLPFNEDSKWTDGTKVNGYTKSKQTTDSNMASDSESMDSNSSEVLELSQAFNFSEHEEDNTNGIHSKEDLSPYNEEVQSKPRISEDFVMWRRIILLDAIRANEEWIAYSVIQATVSVAKARRSAEIVGLKDYDHLDPCRIFHASRLVAILEAYALYDPEIGYCQGMSDLLSPIISVIREDHMAFWCFVGFMKKARHNFRLDEVGIRRQLNIVSKIIKYKDSHLYRHLEKLQAEDCFFVYRMVLVLFRRELTFEQTLCLWEVIWADQAAIRSGIGKSAWSKIRQRAPPTEDLLLYAIAASILQRRKKIIAKYSSMDEILRECNAMAGHLDVWKLLDTAHDLVMTLHDKVETSL